MKNVLRLILFIALVFAGSKVLFSDFNLDKAENKTITLLNE